MMYRHVLLRCFPVETEFWGFPCCFPCRRIVLPLMDRIDRCEEMTGGGDVLACLLSLLLVCCCWFSCLLPVVSVPCGAEWLLPHHRRSSSLARDDDGKIKMTTCFIIYFLGICRLIRLKLMRRDYRCDTGKIFSGELAAATSDNGIAVGCLAARQAIQASNASSRTSGQPAPNRKARGQKRRRAEGTTTRYID